MPMDVSWKLMAHLQVLIESRVIIRVVMMMCVLESQVELPPRSDRGVGFDESYGLWTRCEQDWKLIQVFAVCSTRQAGDKVRTLRPE